MNSEEAQPNRLGAVEYADCIFAEELDPTNECPRYNTKPSDGEVLVLDRWGMRSTSCLPLLLGSLLPGVIVPFRVPSIGQMELFNHLSLCEQMTDVNLNC